MSEWRRALRRTKADDGQKAIVRTLLAIPGVTVALGHDDVLLGYKDRTFWYELKSRSAFKVDGVTPRKGALKDSQAALLESWRGHYRVVSTVEEILADLGIK